MPDPGPVPAEGPYRSVVDVHLILRRADGFVLLAERAGTGYADGLLCVPGGKLEAGEDVRAAAVREAREEVGVDVEDARFVGVVHHRNGEEEARVGFFFAAERWRGEPYNAEPDKCAGLVWADPRALPAHTIGYSAAGIAQLLTGRPFTLDGWGRTPTGQDRPVPTDLVLRSAAELRGDPAFAAEAHRILADLVAGGAALGWVDPPPLAEIEGLVGDLLAAGDDDAAVRAASVDGRLAGFGYWRRYERPTNRPHADLEKLAVAAEAHGRGVGRALASALVEDARRAGIEVLTLDARGDNEPALALYRSLGFTEYGRLPRFAAFGDERYDKVFHALDLRG